MTDPVPQPSTDGRTSGYWVEAPRTTDAIGFVLRDAYEREHAIPEDMAALLRKIKDKIGRAHV